MKHNIRYFFLFSSSFSLSKIIDKYRMKILLTVIHINFYSKESTLKLISWIYNVSLLLFWIIQYIVFLSTLQCNNFSYEFNRWNWKYEIVSLNILQHFKLVCCGRHKTLAATKYWMLHVKFYKIPCYKNRETTIRRILEKKE